jgi:RIO-like serine/threonine protein kinase
MPHTIFPSASEARFKSRNDVLIYEEIRELESEVLTAVDLNEFEVIVSSGSTMTDTPIYQQVHEGLVVDKVIRDQLDQVLRHFNNLGYNIRIRTNTQTENTIQWIIQW